MKNLLKIVTECIDNFSINEGFSRLAAIIGGEAIILHGIPRTTIDIDILFYYQSNDENFNINIAKLFTAFLHEKLGKRFNIKYFEASKDPFAPLKHDLIIITDSENQFKKLDILVANHQWEVEGLKGMESPHAGSLHAYPKAYLAAMKLMAGGAQDEEDVRNLFLVMSDGEKEKAWDLARLIRRDKNLSRLLSERRPHRT